MRIGAHVSVKGGYFNGFVDGQDLGCEAVQIFTSNPRGWAFRQYKEGEVEKFQSKHDETGINPIFAHALYLINLASPDPALLEKSRNALLEEVNRIDMLGMDFAVLHPGSYKNSTPEAATQSVIDSLIWVFEQTPEGKGRVLIEITAGAGNLLACKFEEIQQILDGVGSQWQHRVGMCFDTCHAFASGYDFTTQEKYEDLISQLDATVGLARLFAFHLNDSAEELGSNRDLHEHIGAGQIGKEPFAFFLNDPRFKDHPGVLETEWGDKTYSEMRKDLATLFSLRDK
ncbi:MAG TPA: deoxyribonuclease IV [Candidatus Lokiarchaeia archaeon]|nr:deoxyribonuclease IV [Candidatus Lokiarchaeia archaeon]